VFSRASEGSRVSENIAASQQGVLKVNQWNHVMWHPKEGRFYVDSKISVHGNVYGSTLNGMGTFGPGKMVLVGQSFVGRISALRLWSSLETPQNVLAFFSTLQNNCDAGLGPNVIGFWDFTSCTGHHVPAFKGQSCGLLHPNRAAFTWVDSLVTEYILLDPANDAGHTWVDVCSAKTSCPNKCHPKHLHHTLELKTALSSSTSTSSTKKADCWLGVLKKLNIQYLIAAVFGVVLLLVVIITLCCCKSKGQSNKTEANQVQEDEQVVIPPSVQPPKVEPVYVPLQSLDSFDLTL